VTFGGACCATRNAPLTEASVTPLVGVAGASTSARL